MEGREQMFCLDFRKALDNLISCVLGKNKRKEITKINAMPSVMYTQVVVISVLFSD